MNLENNWQQKSIENLERDFWGEPPESSSSLIEKIYQLRTIPIEKLDSKDIRILIGQNVGLIYIIPLALDLLGEDLFIDSEFYEGDLLENVMKVDDNFWNKNGELKEQLDNLLKDFTSEDKENFKKGNFQ